MCHLRYQNLFQLLKMIDEIDVKGLIPGKIYGHDMKNYELKKLSYELMSYSTKYHEYLHCNFDSFYPTTQRGY